MTSEFPHTFRCTICSPPEHERLVAEISVDGEVICMLLWESDAAAVELKLESNVAQVPLEEFTTFVRAAAAYLRNGQALRPELVLADFIQAGAGPSGPL